MPQVPFVHAAPGPKFAVQSPSVPQLRVQKPLVQVSPERHGLAVLQAHTH